MYYENETHLVGCLGANPEIRTFQNGGRVANLRLATTRKWKNRESGETQEQTEWHQISITSDALVGLVEKYTRKGSYLRIVGRLQTRKWQDQNGNDRYSTEIIVGGYDGRIGLLDRNNSNSSSSGYGGSGSNGGGQDNQQQGGPNNKQIDDEIPF